MTLGCSSSLAASSLLVDTALKVKETLQLNVALCYFPGPNHHFLHILDSLGQNTSVYLPFIISSVCTLLGRDLHQMLVRWSDLGLWPTQKAQQEVIFGCRWSSRSDFSPEPCFSGASLDGCSPSVNLVFHLNIGLLGADGRGC